MAQSRYSEVADTIAKDIERGQYAEREALPSERSLSELFGVSRDTMRKAIKRLETLGYLVSRRGSGTFVAPKHLRSTHSSIDGWTDFSAKQGKRAGQRVLAVELLAPPLAIARLLSVNSGTPIVRIRRVRYLDDTPLGVHESYLILDDPKRLTISALEKTGSLYHLLQDQFGVSLAEATDTISAVAATAEDAKHLGLAEGAPLLRVERLTLSRELMPVEYSDMRHVQTFSYETAVQKRGKTV